jgi:hypothetical protein
MRLITLSSAYPVKGRKVAVIATISPPLARGDEGEGDMNRSV